MDAKMSKTKACFQGTHSLMGEADNTQPKIIRAVIQQVHREEHRDCVQMPSLLIYQAPTPLVSPHALSVVKYFNIAPDYKTN